MLPVFSAFDWGTLYEATAAKLAHFQFLIDAIRHLK
jgi:hypothetical protein